MYVSRSFSPAALAAEAGKEANEGRDGQGTPGSQGTPPGSSSGRQHWRDRTISELEDSDNAIDNPSILQDEAAKYIQRAYREHRISVSQTGTGGPRTYMPTKSNRSVS